jgi:hypothetical protein
MTERKPAMSTGFECLFFFHRDQAYYLLQDWSCPVGAWDWREHATCYGPFADLEAARDHLCKNHPNPGGHTTSKGNTEDALLIKLAEELRANPHCRICGHQPNDTPTGSFDIMEFRQNGWKTFGHVPEHGLCIPCCTSMKANGDIH